MKLKRWLENTSRTKVLVAAVLCLWMTIIHYMYVYHKDEELIRTKDSNINMSLGNINSVFNRNTKLSLGNISVSVCIPAIASDMKLNLPRLLSSVNIQTYIPMEVVIVMSNTKTMECNTFKQRLTAFYNVSILNLYCVSKLQYQSISRQNASSFARGDVVSFIDADDVMFPNRIEVIAAIFHKYRPFMVLHGFSNKANPSWDNKWEHAIMYHGVALFDVEKKTRRYRAWLMEDIMLSQVSVLKDVCSIINFRTDKKFYRTEDAWFVRDVITFFGRKNSTAIFINLPLSWHVPREHQIRKPFWQVPQGFKLRKPSQREPVRDLVGESFDNNNTEFWILNVLFSNIFVVIAIAVVAAIVFFLNVRKSFSSNLSFFKEFK